MFALPALFGAALSPSTIAGFFNLALGIIAAGIDVYDKLKALNQQVKVFVDEGRDPTPEEWEQLKIRSAAAHQTIQDEAERRRG